MKKYFFISLIPILLIIGSLGWFLIRKKQSIKTIMHSSLQEAFGTKTTWNISPLKGGLSESPIFLAENESKKVVIKFIDPQDKDLAISIHKKAALAGYGPNVYYDNPKHGVLIMDFLQSEPINPLTFYQDLATLCKKIHHGPSFKNNGHVWKKVRERLTELSSLNQSIINVAAIKNNLENTINLVQNNLTKAPCHRDLTPNNMIYTNKQFFAIDFDDAGEDDPYIDLAAIAIFYCMNQDSAINFFLKHYFGRTPTTSEKNKFILMKKISLLSYAITFLRFVPADLWNQKPELENYQSYMQKVRQHEISLETPKEQLKFGLILLNEAMHFEAKDL